MYQIAISNGRWTLRLANGYALQGQARDAAEALRRASALAVRLDAWARQRRPPCPPPALQHTPFQG
ncbi:MAG: hypothetical protein HXY37_15915 [Chloroflexi bacterium]|nr:hypothetical protein [Chloroflexota bacterium]